jgi:hypothetical protein
MGALEELVKLNELLSLRIAELEIENREIVAQTRRQILIHNRSIEKLEAENRRLQRRISDLQK